MQKPTDGGPWAVRVRSLAVQRILCISSSQHRGRVFARGGDDFAAVLALVRNNAPYFPSLRSRAPTQRASVTGIGLSPFQERSHTGPAYWSRPRRSDSPRGGLRAPCTRPSLAHEMPAFGGSDCGGVSAPLAPPGRGVGGEGLGLSSPLTPNPSPPRGEGTKTPLTCGPPLATVRPALAPI